MPEFNSFDDIQKHLDKLGLFNSDYSLDRMHRAIDRLNIYDGWHPYTVQVLGTNGKGSVSTFLSSLARCHGLTTALYTSPHFVTPLERIRVNGLMVDGDALVPLARQVYAAVPELTYFEFLTVLALLAFKVSDCRFVVLEAGLGGRYDATTAARVDMSCYVPIDLDHCAILGPTVQAIATDKAAAIRPGCPVVTGVQTDEALTVLQNEAAAKQSPFHRAASVASLPHAVALGLHGPHQRENALLALAAWRIAAQKLGIAASPEAEGAGLAQAFIPGRFQLVPVDGADPAYILDGAHNPHGLRACRAALAGQSPRPAAVVFSCLADKAVADMIPLVLDMAAGVPLVICPIAGNSRAMPADELARLCRSVKHPSGRGPSDVIATPSLEAALYRAAALARGTDRPVLVCGSLYMLGEFFNMKPWLLSRAERPA